MARTPGSGFGAFRLGLAGNVFETLMQIEMVGSDLEWSASGGGCGKGGQSPLPVGLGGPHVRMRDVIVGGRQG